jgi:hypothetical protein
MNPQQIDMARHALGLSNSPSQRKSYRNRFFTEAESPDGLVWQAMVAAGDAKDLGPQKLAGGMHLYVMTHQGALKVLQPGERLCHEDFPEERPNEWLRRLNGAKHGGWMLAPWKVPRYDGEGAEDYKARSEREAATHAFNGNHEGFVHRFSHKPWSIERSDRAPPDTIGVRRRPRKSRAQLQAEALGFAQPDPMPEARHV